MTDEQREQKLLELLANEETNPLRLTEGDSVRIIDGPDEVFQITHFECPRDEQDNHFDVILGDEHFNFNEEVNCIVKITDVNICYLCDSNNAEERGICKDCSNELEQLV